VGKKWTFRSLIWALIFSLVVFGVPLYPVSSVQAAEYATAKLSDVQGGVYVKKSGGGQEFGGFNGMSLTQGDWVRTGDDGFAKIIYDNGTETSLDANTQVVIERLTSNGDSSQTTIKLLAGGIWNKVKSFLNIGDDYEVETPTAVLGVRGTLYYVSQDNRTGTGRGVVFEGQVNGQENNVRGIRRGHELFTGQEFEFGGTPGQQARIGDIDQTRLIAQSRPRILSQILMV